MNSDKMKNTNGYPFSWCGRDNADIVAYAAHGGRLRLEGIAVDDMLPRHLTIIAIIIKVTIIVTIWSPII